MIKVEELASLADVTRVQAAQRGAAVAMRFEGRDTTFAELDQRASRVADKLLTEGLKPQARVAYLAKNSDYFYEIVFGACKARVVTTPVNFRLAPPEVAYVLADSGSEIVFVSSDFADLTDAAVAQMERRPKLVALDFTRDGYEDYEAWRNAGAAIDPLMASPAEDDVIQLYTSGTTGRPKGVQLTNANYLAIFKLAAGVAGFNYGVGENVINAMPQIHVAGSNIGIISVASGARLVIIKDIIPKVVIDILVNEKINHAFFVPAVILMLMQTPELEGADLTNMRSLAYGASPIAEDLLVRAKQRFACTFVQLYGMTETTGAGTFLPDEAHIPGDKRLRSCGIAWPGIEVKVVDENDNEVPHGTVGEIVIRAPIVMKGYWNNPTATADSIRDGWMYTGDAAYQEADGYFYIYDRVKDMIVTGGENVYPAEVENGIYGHPAVADVAVIGVPDEKWGEAVKAICVRKPGMECDAASVIAYARERVANYKVPKSVDFVETIPRNPSGKILRRELREPYWKGHTRRVG